MKWSATAQDKNRGLALNAATYQRTVLQKWLKIAKKRDNTSVVGEVTA
jgi:hypothetical protein